MFSLSVKGKYGLAAALELALRYEQGPVQIRTIADAQLIPQNYLEQILVELKRAGIVQSFRGSQGGYALARSPQSLTVYEIIEALEGEMDLIGTSEMAPGLRFFWKETEDRIKKWLQIPLINVIMLKQKAENVRLYSI